MNPFATVQPPAVAPDVRPVVCVGCGRFHAKDSLITTKDCIRLASIRKMLDSNVNPYSDISKVNLMAGAPNHDAQPIVKKELTTKQRLDKFNNQPVTYRKKRFVTVDTTYIPNHDIKCIACHDEVDSVVAIYARIIVDMVSKLIEAVEIINGISVSVMKRVSFPVYKTGYTCKGCLDTLYAVKYYDKDRNLKRGIEILDRPVTKTKESYRKNHRSLSKTIVEGKPSDNCDRDTKVEVKSISEVVSSSPTAEVRVKRSSRHLPKPVVEDINPSHVNAFVSHKGGRRLY